MLRPRSAKLIMTDADGAGATVLKAVDFAADLCGVCAALEKAPNLPVAGTSLAPSFNAKVQADLLFLGNVIALHAMDLYSKYSLLPMVLPGHPLEVRYVSAASWILVFGELRTVQMDGRGEWGNGTRSEFRSER